MVAIPALQPFFLKRNKKMKKSKINNSVIEEAQHRIESLTKG